MLGSSQEVWLGKVKKAVAGGSIIAEREGREGGGREAGRLKQDSFLFFK